MRLTLSLITASAYFLSAAAAPTPIGACNSYIDLLTGNCDLTGPNEAITPRSVECDSIISTFQECSKVHEEEGMDGIVAHCINPLSTQSKRCLAKFPRTQTHSKREAETCDLDAFSVACSNKLGMTAPVAEIKACIDSTLHSTASCAKVIKLWGMPEMPAEKRQLPTCDAESVAAAHAICSAEGPLDVFLTASVEHCVYATLKNTVQCVEGAVDGLIGAIIKRENAVCTTDSLKSTCAGKTSEADYQTCIVDTIASIDGCAAQLTSVPSKD